MSDSSPPIDHDRLFKELLTTFFVEFIELFFPAVAAYLDPDTVTFLDKELFSDIPGGERREADIIAQARFRGQETFFLVHVEHQAQAEADFDRRMFRYFARLYEQHGLPVYPIALLSYTSPRREEPSRHQVAFPDLTVLQFTYRVVQLNRLNWRDFVRQRNPVASALMARMGIAPQDRPKVKLECLRLLATLRLDPARTHFISGFIGTYLRLTAEEEQRFQAEVAVIPSPQEKEGVMQIVTSWLEEGIEQGIALGMQQGMLQGMLQGMQQGMQQGMHTLILRQLDRMFGTLPPDIAAQVAALATEQLALLGEALFDFTSVADLAAWMQQHPPTSER